MKRRALFVGVDRYEDGAFRDLRYSVADAAALAAAFGRHGFEAHVATNSGNAELLKEVELRSAGLGEGDVFLFFFAGHGYTGPGGEHLLICSDDRLKFLRHNRAGVPVDLLEELTNGGGYHRAFLLDACRTDVFSGKEERGGGTRDLGLVALPDAGKNPGTCCVLRSCDQFCPALEYADLGHGVFTRAMLDLLETPEGRSLAMGEAFAGGVRRRMAALLQAGDVQRPHLDTNGAPFVLFGEEIPPPTAASQEPETGKKADPVAGELCETCGRYRSLTDLFKCRGCGKWHCALHQDPETWLCPGCAERHRAEAESRHRAEEESRKREEERRREEAEAVEREREQARLRQMLAEAKLRLAEARQAAEEIARQKEEAFVALKRAEEKALEKARAEDARHRAGAAPQETRPRASIKKFLEEADARRTGASVRPVAVAQPAVQQREEDRKAPEAAPQEARPRASIKKFLEEADKRRTGASVCPVAAAQPAVRRAGETKKIVLPGGAMMEMVWCPPGTFMMGSPEGEYERFDNETQHRVTLTKGFWMAKTPVTQRQWKSVMGNNPSKFKGDDLPVECVGWEDSQEFCKKAGLRLPTEAEWEYACRAGTAGPYGGTGCLEEMGWSGENSGSQTHPVGQKRANAWGLFDMHGNVLEWCADWYGVYGRGSVTDPMGPVSGSDRVVRGGSWIGNARYCRSASRAYHDPVTGGYYGGFRPCSSAGMP